MYCIIIFTFKMKANMQKKYNNSSQQLCLTSWIVNFNSFWYGRVAVEENTRTYLLVSACLVRSLSLSFSACVYVWFWFLFSWWNNLKSIARRFSWLHDEGMVRFKYSSEGWIYINVQLTTILIHWKRINFSELNSCTYIKCSAVSTQLDNFFLLSTENGKKSTR